MPSLIGPELQCLCLLLIPFWVLGPTLLSPGDFGHYYLKGISADHRALTTFCRFFGSLRHARLTAIQTAFGHNTSLHPLVKTILDYGSQTSTHCSFKNPM